MTRREFLRALTGGLLLIELGSHAHSISARAGAQPQPQPKSPVSLVKAQDRREGVRAAVELLGLPEDQFSGKEVILKPNFNSADPFPGSTHNDTLAALVELLRERGASKIIVADRSGMGVTRSVMEAKGIFKLAEQMGFQAIPIDDLPAEEWEHLPLEGSHWKRGVELPKLFLQAGSIVQTCCLKTHQYGGHFTMSLKNSVGMVARYSVEDGYDYMMELHSSRYQRQMIAEINVLYRPDLIVLDALEAFVRGGPDKGPKESPGVILASQDRVALDAAGVAILRMYQMTTAVARGRIFDQAQIRRAVELGLGASSPEEIELVPAADPESRAFAQAVREILDRG
ncbi:MAG: DUF362 domain-containing protein [Candidatus Acetothermia bacterium]|jgi:uncharacterized protein (DUF362 family)|nr:DUF362 domain-containing protein [Candidatus Acetothermia bacterium]MDH7504928.1 DUF362 domain-containing protein [Candidatus Acetothermia bacterium]